MKSFADAKRELRSSGKFPLASEICHSLPLSGLENISAVRVMMAMFWIHDVTDGSDEGHAIEVHLGELRAAAGLADSGSYRSTREGMRSLERTSLVFSDGRVCDLLEFVAVQGAGSDQRAVFRFSDEIIALQKSLSDIGYGMVNMSEVHRLARPIDLPVYLRFCAVRKRRKKITAFARDEVYSLTLRDPEGQFGGALRALKTSISRVSSIMKAEAVCSNVTGAGRDRVSAVEIALR